ncbi:MFS transporter [Novosphingobium sp. MMS21-SN21R]|uniref:MFS transporter n=1 Tax=Novosphingobium sp. MMS21-SN21R TaxID=2969298 RepID=UPI002885B133|nr:MFS transporter [Novosphingobium sp. MMS21-SN21R]MDT0509823.1 MFS transporter [Novosphingobium sp. MMS21-SN21R]
MSTRIEGNVAAEWRANWTVVMAACAGMAMASIISYSSGLFIEPFEREFGWSRVQIMSGHSIAATIAAICAPFMGVLVDRYGPRRIGIAAVFTICGSIALFSQTGPDIWHWRLLWLPMTLGIVLVQPMVWTAAVTSLFSAGRGLALAVTLCGSSLASIVVPKMTHSLIEAFGWRLAWVGLGSIWLVIAMPLIWFFFTSVVDRDRTRRTEKVAPVVRASVWQSGILSWRFPVLLVAGVSIALVVVTMVVSIVPVLSASGIARGDAAWIAGLVGFTAIFGRLAIGSLLDRMDGRLIAAACVSMPIVAIFLLIALPGSIVAAAIAVLIFGFSLGAELDIVAYLTSRYFGRENFGFLFGTIGGCLGFASGNGPVALNAVYDATGSYTPALWAAIPLCLLSAALFLCLGRYPDAAPLQPVAA